MVSVRSGKPIIMRSAKSSRAYQYGKCGLPSIALQDLVWITARSSHHARKEGSRPLAAACFFVVFVLSTQKGIGGQVEHYFDRPLQSTDFTVCVVVVVFFSSFFLFFFFFFFLFFPFVFLYFFFSEQYTPTRLPTDTAYNL